MSLIAYPRPKLSLTLWNVAAAVISLVLDELIEPSLPRHDRLFQCPLEADAAEPIDAILRKRTSPVGRSLMAYPRPKLALAPLNVAVAVLCLVLDELVESILPRNCLY